MPPPSVAWAAGVALCFAVVDWFAVARGSRRLELVAKPAVIVALIVGVALAPPVAAAGAGDATLARNLVLAALAASLAGDLLLIPPVRFVPGLVAFLLAQLAYLGRFALEPLGLGGLLVGVAVALAVGILVGKPILVGARRQRLAVPVAVYLVAIFAMALAATGTGRALAALGAWLFVASDAILGLDRFAREGTVRTRVANLVTYHLAQVLLVVAVAT